MSGQSLDTTFYIPSSYQVRHLTDLIGIW